MSRFIPFPFTYDAMPIDISSVFASEKPAGKHGFLKVEGSHFVFEDGTPARFWGTNLNSGACFPEFKYAEKLAKRLAMAGINIVRFHQMDAEWSTPNLFSFQKGERVTTTRQLHPESIKRLDYLVKCLKDNGIYCYLDMNTYRKFKSGDGVENTFEMKDAGKPYTHFSRKLIELQKEFAYNIWTHINPYTGLAYKDDPVFVMSETVNETNLTHPSFRFEIEPYCTEFRQMYRAWLDKNGLEDDAENTDLNDNENATLFQFKVEVMTNFHTEMRDYMRSIGVKIPITGENMLTDMGVHKANRNMDYMDSHTYFSWTQWKENELRNCFSTATTQVPNFGMASLASMRDLKRPFFVSEWDMPWPSHYRAESSILYAAVGALQGWDGFTIHTYAYGSHLDRADRLGVEVSSRSIGNGSHREGRFASWNDPAKFGLFYHAALITRRGDIKEATASTEVLIKDLTQRAPVATQVGTEVDRLGIVFEDETPVADRVLAQDERNVPEEATEVRSSTGEMYRNWAKNYGTIDSERTKCVYGFLGKNGKLDVTGMSVEAKTDFAVVALSSLTDEAIETSDNLLLTTVGRAENTGMKYESGMILDMGQPPVLVEVIEAEVAIKTERKDLICWAVNAEGYFIGKVPARYEDGCLKLTLGQTMPSMYYLIQAE